MSGKWQAATLPPSLGVSGGSSTRQSSCAFQQRVWKRQPDLTASRLAGELPMTRQAVTKHLAALDRAGLVTPRREGRELRYALDPAPMGAAIAWMASVGAHWDDRLARLARRAAQG